MNHTPGENPNPKSTPEINWLIVGLAVAFVITAGITAFLTYIAVRDIVLTGKLPGLSSMAVDQTAPALPDEIEDPGTFVQTPLQPSGGPAPEPWDSVSHAPLRCDDSALDRSSQPDCRDAVYPSRPVGLHP